MRTNRRVQTETDMLLFDAAATYPRQYIAYTTWWVDGEYDGSIMLRVFLFQLRITLS
jgi:hypothetical protein